MMSNVEYDSELTYFFNRNNLKVVVISQSSHADGRRGVFHLRNFPVEKNISFFREWN